MDSGVGCLFTLFGAHEWQVRRREIFPLRAPEVDDHPVHADLPVHDVARLFKLIEQGHTALERGDLGVHYRLKPGKIEKKNSAFNTKIVNCDKI